MKALPREIKFKAHYDGRIYDVTEIMWSNLTVFIWRSDVEDGDGEIVALDDVQLLQFTGLKDKNGKEIYEGDIVRWHYIEEGIAAVEYADEYASYRPFNQLRFERVAETFEVIGNIYENPNLLK